MRVVRVHRVVFPHYAMNREALYLLMCLGVSIYRVGGECVVGDSTYQEGDEWGAEEGCKGFVCQADGTPVSTECEVPDVLARWTVSEEDGSLPYPECCPRAVPPLDIVPDVLDKMHLAEFLDLTYDGDLGVEPGNELDPLQVAEPPEVNFTADPAHWHLLLMTDPDAPSRQFPKLREVQHWLVGNIPGYNVSAGEVLSEYLAPEPAPGTGLHRYVFLVYRQFGKLDYDERKLSNSSMSERLKFSTQNFAQKYKLSDPVAMNVFQAQWDERVVALRRLDRELPDTPGTTDKQ